MRRGEHERYLSLLLQSRNTLPMPSRACERKVCCCGTSTWLHELAMFGFLFYLSLICAVADDDDDDAADA